jgi:hypothetical protein
MYRVTINNQTVFEGNLKKVGGGGTKTAYKLENTDYVVLLPNWVDGAVLVNIFDMICDDEVFMYNHLISNQLLGLKVEHCFVQQISGPTIWGQPPIGVGNSMCGLYAPSFSSFSKELAHVFDKKDTITFNWDQPKLESIQDCVEVLKPLVEDLDVAINCGVIPYGDSYNFLIAEQGSPYYRGSGRYAVRYFGFDFASKRHALSPFRDLKDQTKGLMLEAISEAIDYIGGYIGNLSEVEQDQLRKELIKLI